MATSGVERLDRLSATDTSFLVQERDGAHMHIGSVAIFEGPPPRYQDLLEHVASRLVLVPRFRQRLVFPPAGLGRPLWADDPSFNLEYHLRHVALPRPGTEAELRALVGRVFSQRLDRGKPLWELYLVEGLPDGRFALIMKTHHALVDGISGVDLASVLLDVDPVPQPAAPALDEPQPDPTPAQLVAKGVADALHAEGRLAERSLRALLAPRTTARAAADVAAGIGRAAWELLNPAPDVPLNRAIGPHRRVTWVEAELEDLRRVKQAADATVNDVVLAAATGALRSWLVGRGVRPEGLELRALVPVSLRQEDERGLLGNRIALLRVPLPVYASDAEARLRLVRDATRAAKGSRQLAGAQTIVGLSAWAPPTVLAQASRLNFSTHLFNLIVTNVPGPQLPLYLLGRELERVVPVAFLPKDHALSIAVFSYNGKVSFGLLGDWDAMYDLDLLTGSLADELAALATLPPRERERQAAPGPKDQATRVPALQD